SARRSTFGAEPNRERRSSSVSAGEKCESDTRAHWVRKVTRPEARRGPPPFALADDEKDRFARRELRERHEQTEARVVRVVDVVDLDHERLRAAALRKPHVERGRAPCLPSAGRRPEPR